MSKVRKEPKDKWMRTIKEQRIHEGMTVDELRVGLESYGCNVATKTIYGWESGSARPDVNTFLLMCQILKISDLRLFVDFPDGTEDAMILSDTEVEIVKKYRKTKQLQEAFNRLLDE